MSENKADISENEKAIIKTARDTGEDSGKGEFRWVMPADMERLKQEQKQQEAQERRRLEEDERRRRLEDERSKKIEQKRKLKEEKLGQKQKLDEERRREREEKRRQKQEEKLLHKEAVKKTREEKPKKPKKPRKKMKAWQIAVIVILCLMLAGVIAVGGYAGYIICHSEEITPENIYSHVEMSSFLYDRDGHEIDRIYYTEDREPVSIDQIPEVTRNAFIAIEDKTFYEHHGFNFRRMIGAVFNKLIGRSEEISGTSTITQQLARNVFLADVKSQRSLNRKFREMVYAWEIEQALTKDQILEAYLNTIYLGYGTYGIESAARTYFDRDVQKLDLAQSAALAALPQAPDSYALLRDEKDEGLVYLRKYDVYANDLSKDRRNLVLDLMTEQGYITKAEADEARVDIKDILKPSFEEGHSNEYTYFTDYTVSQVVKDIAEKYQMSEEEAQRFVYTGGLHINTTVDPDVQTAINEEFADDYNFPWSEEEPQAAMVVTEVGTGRIVGMVGGREASGKKLFNRATSPRQPGSSIKPLSVYSAALQKSFDYAAEGKTFPFIDYGFDRQGTSYWGDYITASSQVIDERMYVNGEIWPQNFSRRFSGRQTFRTALQQSINTCAVKIQLQVGADYSMSLLKKFGITTAVDDIAEPVNDLNSAALGLGAMTYGVTPLEMALAYAVFPNGGVCNTPVCYTEVTDAGGRVILTGRSEETRVLDEGVDYIMTDCLQSVVSRGIARAASLYGVQSGGKTGTTNDTADIWFCGFVPKYSAALWIGTDHNSEMNTTSTTAAALWRRIMSRIPEVADGEYREMPDNVVIQRGEYYTEGTEPWRRY